MLSRSLRVSTSSLSLRRLTVSAGWLQLRGVRPRSFLPRLRPRCLEGLSCGTAFPFLANPLFMETDHRPSKSVCHLLVQTKPYFFAGAPRREIRAVPDPSTKCHSEDVAAGQMRVPRNWAADCYIGMHVSAVSGLPSGEGDGVLADPQKSVWHTFAKSLRRGLGDRVAPPRAGICVDGARSVRADRRGRAITGAAGLRRGGRLPGAMRFPVREASGRSGGAPAAVVRARGRPIRRRGRSALARAVVKPGSALVFWRLFGFV